MGPKRKGHVRAKGHVQAKGHVRARRTNLTIHPAHPTQPTHPSLRQKLASIERSAGQVRCRPCSWLQPRRSSCSRIQGAAEAERISNTYADCRYVRSSSAAPAQHLLHRRAVDGERVQAGAGAQAHALHASAAQGKLLHVGALLQHQLQTHTDSREQVQGMGRVMARGGGHLWVYAYTVPQSQPVAGGGGY